MIIIMWLCVGIIFGGSLGFIIGYMSGLDIGYADCLADLTILADEDS